MAVLPLDHQKVIRDRVELVKVALARLHLRRRPGRHLLIENPVAERHGGVDFGVGAGDARLQRALHDGRRALADVGGPNQACLRLDGYPSARHAGAGRRLNAAMFFRWRHASTHETCLHFGQRLRRPRPSPILRASELRALA